MSTIYQRRSIRKYQDKDIEEELILEVIRAAMHAPSAGNEQPWHFVVIKDRETKEKIVQSHPYAKMILKAPVAVVICADLTLVKFGEFWVQDCSAATQNMLLRATEVGLGAVWCGVYPDEARVTAFGRILNLPKNVVAFSLVCIGYPAENPEPVDRFKQERIHFERW
ncbi:nitroreductase family protein [Pseudothermotoga sp. U03pept]|uniref:nitroreductase family protein n=1 Tax=Pseudothermotoga sp. U03pept TaxID=3447012 RepID=UPI003F050C9D